MSQQTPDLDTLLQNFISSGQHVGPMHLCGLNQPPLGAPEPNALDFLKRPKLAALFETTPLCPPSAPLLGAACLVLAASQK